MSGLVSKRTLTTRLITLMSKPIVLFLFYFSLGLFVGLVCRFGLVCLVELNCTKLPYVALCCPKLPYFTLSCPTLPYVALSYPKVGLYCSKAESRVPGGWVGLWWWWGGGGANIFVCLNSRLCPR